MRLTTLPPSLAVEAPSLRVVDLSHNSFAAFPEVLFQLVSVEALDLSHNRIASVNPLEQRLARRQTHKSVSAETTLRTGGSALIRLAKISLAFNCLEAVPAELTEMPAVRWPAPAHPCRARLAGDALRSRVTRGCGALGSCAGPTSRATPQWR